MKKVVILSGAGISAESGISTFRDNGGLWEQYDVMEVASAQGWKKNPGLVLDFYNMRRAQLAGVESNRAHLDIAALEKDYDVVVITQNVDNLHEKAGSSRSFSASSLLKRFSWSSLLFVLFVAFSVLASRVIYDVT